MPDFNIQHSVTYEFARTAMRNMNRCTIAGDTEEANHVANWANWMNTFVPLSWALLENNRDSVSWSRHMYWTSRAVYARYSDPATTITNKLQIQADLASITNIMAAALAEVVPVYLVADKVITMGTFAGTVRGYAPQFGIGSIDDNQYYGTITQAYVSVGSENVTLVMEDIVLPVGETYPIVFRVTASGFTQDFTALTDGSSGLPETLQEVNKPMADAILAIPDGEAAPFTIQLISSQ